MTTFNFGQKLGTSYRNSPREISNPSKYRVPVHQNLYHLQNEKFGRVEKGHSIRQLAGPILKGQLESKEHTINYSKFLTYMSQLWPT